MSGAFATLKAQVNDFVAQGRFPGVSLLIWRAGAIIEAHSAGWRDLSRRLPMQRDTLVRLASMSKPITSFAALILVGEGRLALADPISKWLPEAATLTVLRTPFSEIDDVVPLERLPTVRDLFTHTAGFAWGKGIDLPITRAMLGAAGETPFVSYDPDTFTRRVCAVPLIRQPGAGWHYGISTDLLGVIIARASGKTLPEFLQSRIFDPIGMRDTGFCVPGHKLGRFAVGYARDDVGRFVAHDNAQTGFWSRPPIFPAGGGGLVSTADDYINFARVLLNAGMVGRERVLPEYLTNLMTTNLLNPEQLRPIDNRVDFLRDQGFGAGLSITLARPWSSQQDNLRRRKPGSFSWPGGYATTWFADPRENLVAVLMSQVWQDSLAELGPALENGVYSA